MNHTILSAFSEPRRLQIVELLQYGLLTVGEVAERLHFLQPQASKHLRVLYDAVIVDVSAEGNRRLYKLRAEPFKEMNAWLEQYRELWNEKLDNLERYLQELQY